MSCICYTLHNTRWWKVLCMRLDCYDYLNGDLSKKEFLDYMRIDLEELKKELNKLEKET